MPGPRTSFYWLLPFLSLTPCLRGCFSDFLNKLLAVESMSPGLLLGNSPSEARWRSHTGPATQPLSGATNAEPRGQIPEGAVSTAASPEWPWGEGRGSLAKHPLGVAHAPLGFRGTLRFLFRGHLTLGGDFNQGFDHPTSDSLFMLILPALPQAP